MPVTADEVLAYLGIDYTDDMIDASITRSIESADAFLKSAIGDDYPTDDPRAKELALIVVADMFDNRGLHAPTNVSANIRRLVNDFILQLQMELRRASSDEDDEE